MEFAGINGAQLMQGWIREEFAYITRKRDCGTSDFEEERRIRQELQLPEFDGRDCDDWILEMEDIFHFFWLNEEEKLKAAILSLDGDALRWFEWEHQRRPFFQWEELKEQVVRFFPTIPATSWRVQPDLVQRSKAVVKRNSFVQSLFTSEQIPDAVEGNYRTSGFAGNYYSGGLIVGGRRWETEKCSHPSGSFEKLPEDNAMGNVGIGKNDVINNEVRAHTLDETNEGCKSGFPNQKEKENALGPAQFKPKFLSRQSGPHYTRSNSPPQALQPDYFEKQLTNQPKLSLLNPANPFKLKPTHPLTHNPSDVLTPSKPAVKGPDTDITRPTPTQHFNPHFSTLHLTAPFLKPNFATQFDSPQTYKCHIQHVLSCCGLNGSEFDKGGSGASGSGGGPGFRVKKGEFGGANGEGSYVDEKTRVRSGGREGEGQTVGCGSGGGPGVVFAVQLDGGGETWWWLLGGFLKLPKEVFWRSLAKLFVGLFWELILKVKCSKGSFVILPTNKITKEMRLVTRTGSHKKDLAELFIGLFNDGREKQWIRPTQPNISFIKEILPVGLIILWPVCLFLVQLKLKVAEVEFISHRSTKTAQTIKPNCSISLYMLQSNTTEKSITIGTPQKLALSLTSEDLARQWKPGLKHDNDHHSKGREVSANYFPP